MRANAFIVETNLTWLRVTDIPSGDEPIEAHYPQQTDSEDEATRNAQAELDRVKAGQTQITVGIDPTGSGDVPFEDFGIGDLCDVDGAVRRCVSITASRDPDNGRLIYLPQFGDIIEHPALLQQKISRRFNPGSLGGVSRTAARPTVPQFLPADATVRTPIVHLTQAEYDALDPGPVDGVMYAIVG